MAAFNEATAKWSGKTQRANQRKNQQSNMAISSFFALFSSFFFGANEIQFNVHLHAAKGAVIFFFLFFRILCYIECERLTNHRTGRRRPIGRVGVGKLPAAVS